jgi:hypothetical protein
MTRLKDEWGPRLEFDRQSDYEGFSDLGVQLDGGSFRSLSYFKVATQEGQPLRVDPLLCSTRSAL